MINNLELFLKEANQLLSAMTEYKEATIRLCEIDLNQEELTFAIDDIENVLEEREDIMQSAETARIAMTDIIEGQEEPGVELIRDMFDGSEIQLSLSADESLAKDVIMMLLAMQKEIMEKDIEFEEKLKAKRSEIKAAMKNLQGDKKKLDYLHLSTSLGQEQGFQV